MKIVNIDMRFEAAEEAAVELSDGTNSIIVFCQPCKYKVGQEIQDYLQPMFIENLQISDCKTPKIVKLHGSIYKYKIYATVLNYEESIVCVGGIKFEINETIHFWVSEGDVVEFETLRIDLW